jgi:two-component system cell cycle response regulator DivK
MRRRILIIEDNEPNLYLLTYILESSGYEVLAARDGLEGLSRAQIERPDLVLTDLQMPGIDGYEVARRLRTHPETAAIPVVAVTAYAMIGDRERALACGCVGYIEKPILPSRFRDQIAGYMREAEQPPAGRARRAV